MSSVLPTVLSGMNAAMQRFNSAASSIAGGSGDNLDEAAVELMMSRISLEADARVAQMVAQTADRLLDITV